MKKLFLLTISIFNLFFSFICGADFTLASYNCGGLTDHYNYIRAATMQKLMQARFSAEPELMARIDKVQEVALKVLFAKDIHEQQKAKQKFDEEKYQAFFDCVTAAPTELKSPNKAWYKLSQAMLSEYHVRPVDLRDDEVVTMLTEHLKDLCNENNEGIGYEKLLNEGRRIMSERIFAHHMKVDIICLQEADYLDPSMFPEHYQVVFSDTEHSINGIAWNKNRFELLEQIGDIMQRGFAVKLMDKESGITILVASGHLSGCNPFKAIEDPVTNSFDASKGDQELTTIFELFENQSADIKLIGMDSNVTAMHPRMKILKNFGYQLDYENHLEPTCTSPYQIINTRIDWIAAKSKGNFKLTNIPILNVPLNNIQTNVSDHKPIAVRISF